MKLCYLFLLLTVEIWCATLKDGNKVFYRKDYRLLEEFDAFYKYHKVMLNFSDASAKCTAEGGSLFRPLSLKESLSVMSSYVPKDIPRIWLGIHDLYSEGDFITLDGVPLEDTYSNWAPGEPNDAGNNEDCVVLFRDGGFNDGTCFTKEPYVCKRDVSTLTQNTLCETYDLGYEYSVELDKCYKIHTRPAKWSEAFKTCKGEESNLAMINSETEAKYLVNQMTKYPMNRFTGNFDKHNFHLGFNDLINDGVYRTIDGKTLAEAGYENWGPGQPDQHGGSEHCGAMFRDGKLNDLDCSLRAMYFCEKDLSRHGQPPQIEQVADHVSSKDTTERTVNLNTQGGLVELPDAS